MENINYDLSLVIFRYRSREITEDAVTAGGGGELGNISVLRTHRDIAGILAKVGGPQISCGFQKIFRFADLP